ncbi:hypothetical protein D5086_016138 [Populus alba]|uniref:Uncharacterized protein n=2 Tax=Populus alba TaxID=43335 RepID=A0ACC4BUD3_POPAL|nr:hypothetical protein D5086_0000209460 [Populus alba]
MPAVGWLQESFYIDSGEERLKALQESYKKLVDAYKLAASFWMSTGAWRRHSLHGGRNATMDSSGRRALRLQIENGFEVIDDDLEWKLAKLLYYIFVHINFSFNQRKILLHGG